MSTRAWERAVVIAFLLALVALAVWDYNRTHPTWLTSGTEVTLYFTNEDATGLVAEKRRVWGVDDPVEAVLTGLIEGPESVRLGRTIPPGVRVLGYHREGAILYVDFSKELQTRHPGGSTGEIMTVYSIVNSLTELPDVEQVVITVGGELQETLVGHLILDEPLLRQEGLIVTE